ncbi:GntR family transcriptional regulator [Eilatimonas milleporae]|uniref:DNA-binding GntR family transcriptional regulator n=1 Tax=Eilatimonas milleporae TaxID=911205 RepID=A0A3M0CLN8_9PROT|nr:GntR family transcriptional regulator [Eilatimonas milleporae]RMB07979.1 DNA-binding GntR family transcriptional regulator [Eilatimonas milleporae]
MATATEKAYDIIRRNILDGVFEAGTHLKEEDLVRLCGVSRTPVRDALRRLAIDHYVVTRPNQGTFVNQWSLKDIHDIFELRAMLEGVVARRAAAAIGPGHMAALKQAFGTIQAMLADDAADLDVNLFLAENKIFHMTMLQAADSAPLATMLSSLVQPPIVARTALGYNVEDLRQSNEHHRELIEALGVGDGAWAEAIMQAHIRAAHRKFMASYRPGGGFAAP